jgi:hypothetical protein
MTQSDTLYKVTYREWNTSGYLLNAVNKYLFADTPVNCVTKLRQGITQKIEVERVDAVLKANEILGEEWS